MSKATDEALAELHGEMARVMKTRLNSDDLTASDLGVIRQFLKDNGINSDGREDPNVKNLTDDLPEDLDGDGVIPFAGNG